MMQMAHDSDECISDSKSAICSECGKEYEKRSIFDISGKCDDCFKKQLDKLTNRDNI